MGPVVLYDFSEGFRKHRVVEKRNSDQRVGLGDYLGVFGHCVLKASPKHPWLEPGLEFGEAGRHELIF